MAPTRRYLRLTAHTVLEVRIYLDNPTDTHRWLLHSSYPALPSVIAAVRPYVLPRLHEENARPAGKRSGAGSGGGGGGTSNNRKKGWKEVIHTEDFEVAMFLTETSVRHSILKREKDVRSKGQDGKRLGTKQGRLTGTTREDPMFVGDGDGDGHRGSSSPSAPPGLLREGQGVDDDDDDVKLADVPLEGERPVGGESGDGLFVSDGEEDTSLRVPTNGASAGGDGGGDDKKKLALDTTYDGFSIYGRILCLVVKRKGGAAKGPRVPTDTTGQAMMEQWISSTQAGEGGMMDE